MYLDDDDDVSTGRRTTSLCQAVRGSHRSQATTFVQKRKCLIITKPRILRANFCNTSYLEKTVTIANRGNFLHCSGRREYNMKKKI